MGKLYQWLPVPEQEIILKTALSGSEEALLYWEKFKSDYDIEKLDSGSNRLLPLVYENLKNSVNDGDDLYPMLEGTQKKYWYKNQMLLNISLRLFDELEMRGIDITPLKGVHLISMYYDSIALRPMGDVDFHVPWDQAEKTGKILDELGWAMVAKFRYPVFRENFMSMIKSVGYSDKTGYQCDLHWNLISHRCFPEADISFLKNRTRIGIKGRKFNVLCPEDLILLLLEHGAYSNVVPSVRWIPDLIMILRKEKNISWDHIIHNTYKMNLELPVKLMLEYLESVFGIEGVTTPLKKLQITPFSKESEKLYKSMLPAGTDIGQKFREFFRLYSRYRIYVKEHRGNAPSRGFINFLKFKWGVSSNTFFPFIFLRKFIKKTVRYIRAD